MSRGERYAAILVRLSEKTLELNICAQVARAVPHPPVLIWFGLTQKQEARAGFDACTRLNGRLLIFQFKASNRVQRSGERLFQMPHQQFVQLRARVGAATRSIFYAFPLVGTTLELTANPDLLSQTWLMDVATVPALPVPTTDRGRHRRNGCHNVYVVPGHATIHSDPVEQGLFPIKELCAHVFEGADGVKGQFEQNADKFLEFCRLFGRGAYGLVVARDLDPVPRP